MLNLRWQNVTGEYLYVPYPPPKLETDFTTSTQEFGVKYVIFWPKLAKKRLSSTSALVDGVLEKNHTSALVQAFSEKIGFFSKNGCQAPLSW